jgi:hypothetical protein
MSYIKTPKKNINRGEKYYNHSILKIVRKYCIAGKNPSLA